jgi:hypothetical protein
MPKRKSVTHRPSTIPAAAKAVGIPEQVLLRAVDLGEVEAVRISGLRRVPPHEIERLRSLFPKDLDG